jgi:hypothetical protein
MFTLFSHWLKMIKLTNLLGDNIAWMWCNVHADKEGGGFWTSSHDVQGGWWWLIGTKMAEMCHRRDCLRSTQVFSAVCSTSHRSSNLQNVIFLQTSYPVASISPPPHTPGKHHSLSFYQLRLFQIPHISKIMQYLSFCAWLISLSMTYTRLIHIVRNDRK